jgi:hypothetical protein
MLERVFVKLVREEVKVVGYSVEGGSVKNKIEELCKGAAVGANVGAGVATTNGACVGDMICLFAAALMAAAAAI